MQQLQLISITPDELRRFILEGVSSTLEDFRDNLRPNSESEYLTRKEVSELLKINLSTIHNWVKSNKLKAYGIGNRVYFKRSEIDKAMIELKK